MLSREYFKRPLATTDYKTGGIIPPEPTIRAQRSFKRASLPLIRHSSCTTIRGKRREKHLQYIYQKVFINSITEDQTKWCNTVKDHKRYIKQQKRRQRTNIGPFSKRNCMLLLVRLVVRNRWYLTWLPGGKWHISQ